MTDQGEEGGWTKHDEYAVQYFGFLPQTLFNGMYNAIWEYTKEAMSTLNENILFTFKENVSETELQEVSNKQKKVAMDRLDAKFDKAEYYLNNNVFKIPEHIVLPEDKVNMENPCSQEEMNALDEELKTVTDKIIAVKYANTQLQDRINEICDVQQNLDTTLSGVDKMYFDVSTQSQEFMHTVNNFQQVASFLDQSKSESLKI